MEAVLDEILKQLKSIEREVRKLKSVAAPKPTTEVSNITKVREQFLACYRKQYGHEYPSWGAKENGQAKQWLRSVAIEKALALIPFFLKWNDTYAVKTAHSFSVLITHTVALEAWINNADAQAFKLAHARVTQKLTVKTAEDLIHARRYAEQARRADEISTSDRKQIQNKSSK